MRHLFYPLRQLSDKTQPLYDEDINKIKQQTTLNGKIYFQKEIEIYDQNKQIIARVLRTIYIKDKKFIAADNEKPVKN